MLRLKFFITTVLLCVLISGGSVFAQEQISGPQSGTLGPGTYIVVGDILVLGGNTLEIVPGTEFLHNGHHTWEIYGMLTVSGAEDDSVYFVRQFPTEQCKWGGIRFLYGASDASSIDYAVIDHCKNSIQPYYRYGGGIYTDEVDITVTNSRISFCEAYWDGGGIYADDSNILIDKCLIVDNTAISGANGGGIYLNNCDEAMVSNCVIARNNATGT